MELTEAIEKRKSRRNFGKQVSTELGALLYVAKKTPSAGGIHPLRFKALYSDTDSGFDELSKCCSQNFILKARGVIIIYADTEKIVKRYRKRGFRYIYIEAGHAAQNIVLKATELGINNVCVGAFNDKKLGAYLSLKRNEIPVYLVVLG